MGSKLIQPPTLDNVMRELITGGEWAGRYQTWKKLERMPESTAVSEGR